MNHREKKSYFRPGAPFKIFLNYFQAFLLRKYRRKDRDSPDVSEIASSALNGDRFHFLDEIDQEFR